MRGRTGTAQLPLHGGRAPAWLFSRMVRFARRIGIHVVFAFGPEEMRRRLEAGEHATQHRDDRPANDEPRR